MQKKSDKIIPIRRVDFQGHIDLDNHWFGGNAFLTHLLNSFHIVFPEGEKFFIRSVKAFKDQTQDPKLREQIKGFIGQEMQHSKEHEKFWNALKDQGYAVDEFVGIYNKLAYDITENTIHRLTGSSKLALSTTVALEHYTAILAQVAFRSDALTKLEVPEEIRNLLYWHAAEEMEHKSVAFDLLKEVDDSYLLRFSGMIIATANLLFYSALGMAIFMWQDKELKLWDIPGHIADFLGMGMGPILSFTRDFLDYFRPDFHPEDHEDHPMALEYLNRDSSMAEITKQALEKVNHKSASTG